MALSSPELNHLQQDLKKSEPEIEAIVVSSTGGEDGREGLNFVAAFEATENRHGVTRFLGVSGYDNRTNDLIYAPPFQTETFENGVESSTTEETDGVMVYFGGDIQDFREAMDVDLENRAYMEWNLDKTASLLQRQFPHRHIVVVRPNRMHLRTFACFDNFLPSSHHGIPEHTPFHGALLHLKNLLSELSTLIPLNTQHTSSLALHRRDIALVGFSKGAVVLNQFLYEFHYLKTLTPDDESLEDFLNCLKDMYWLDGGHSGGKNTWIVSRSLLETLTRLNIRIHVHLTPYQMADEGRALIQKEESLFSEALRASGARIQRYLHFQNQSPSLALHFQLLADFGSPNTSDLFADDDGSFVETVETEDSTPDSSYVPPVHLPRESPRSRKR